MLIARFNRESSIMKYKKTQCVSLRLPPRSQPVDEPQRFSAENAEQGAYTAIRISDEVNAV
jgi:hypothetical protein